jgi:papain like protease
MRRILTILAFLVLLIPMGLSLQQAPPAYAVGQQATEPHGLGLNLPIRHFHVPATDKVPSGLPASVDLSQYVPVVGDQGSVGSCASWAIGYYLRGWYANKYGDYPTQGFAPMSIYSRIVADYDQGQDNGSTLAQAAGEVKSYGITPQAQYAQGNYDYTDTPTPEETAAGLPYHAAGYSELYQAPLFGGGDPQAAIEASLAAGTPVVIGFFVYQEYEDYGLFSPPVPAPTEGEFTYGGHANIAYGYTAQGLLVRNQWGAGWGRNGDGVLSWAYVDAAVEEVAALDVPVSPTPNPLPTPQPTPAQPDLVGWPHPQPAKLPATLPPGRYKEEIIVTDSLGRVRAMAVVGASKQ